MKPATPKTEPSPSTQIRNVVFGGSHVKTHLIAALAFSVLVSIASAEDWGAYSIVPGGKRETSNSDKSRASIQHPTSNAEQSAIGN